LHQARSEKANARLFKKIAVKRSQIRRWFRRDLKTGKQRPIKCARCASGAFCAAGNSSQPAKDATPEMRAPVAMRPACFTNNKSMERFAR
jgi:hypothetical protein